MRGLHPRRRPPYKPQLEQVESRSLPGQVLGGAILSSLNPFSEPGARADDALSRRLSDWGLQDRAPSAGLADPALIAAGVRDGTGAASPAAGTVSASAGPGLVARVTPHTDLEAAVNSLGGGVSIQSVGSLVGIVREALCVGIEPAEPPPEWPFVRVADVGVVLDDQFQVTAEDGSYAFEAVPAGTYTVGFFVQGFGEARETVTIQTGEQVRLDIYLAVGTSEAAGQFRARFVPGTPPEEIDALNEAYGVTVLEASGTVYRLRIPEGAYTDDYLDAYRQEPIVQSAQRIFAPPYHLCL